MADQADPRAEDVREQVGTEWRPQACQRVVHPSTVRIATLSVPYTLMSGVSMRGKTVVITAVVALAVVIGYDYYKTKRAG